MEKYKAWESNNGEGMEGVRYNKGIHERKREIIFPVIFDISCTSSNVILRKL
jgi:hypothetical protein